MCTLKVYVISKYMLITLIIVNKKTKSLIFFVSLQRVLGHNRYLNGFHTIEKVDTLFLALAIFATSFNPQRYIEGMALRREGTEDGTKV